jgi:hypothetical protein
MITVLSLQIPSHFTTFPFPLLFAELYSVETPSESAFLLVKQGKWVILGHWVKTDFSQFNK